MPTEVFPRGSRDEPLPAATAMSLDHQLCFALHSTSLAMNRLYTALLAALELTYPQYLVLLVLWERDGRSVTEIGERLFLDSGTLTPMLKRLEANGVVRRERDSEDERRMMIRLTAKGRQLRQRASTVPRRVFAATGCSLQEVTRLTDELQQLRDRIQT